MTPIDQRAREAAAKMYPGPLTPADGFRKKVLYTEILNLLTAQHAEDVAAGEKLRIALREISDKCPHLDDTEVGSLSDYGNNGDDYAAAFAKVTESAIGDIARAALTQPTQP